MPLYEYECNCCRRRFTALVGAVAGPNRPACPQCGYTDLRKLVSPFCTPRSRDNGREGPNGAADEPLAELADGIGDEVGEGLGTDFDEALREMGSEDDQEAVP